MVEETADGLLVYPNAAPERPLGRIIQINGVWFSRYQREMARRGRPAPAKMSQVAKAQQQQAKKAVTERLMTGDWELQVRIRKEDARLIAYSLAGQRIGVIGRSSAEHVEDGQVVRLRPVVAQDGNICGLLL